MHASGGSQGLVYHSDPPIATVALERWPAQPCRGNVLRGSDTEDQLGRSSNFLWYREVAMLAYVLQILEWNGYTDMCEHECVQLFLAVKNSVASMVCSSLGYNRLIALQSWVL